MKLSERLRTELRLFAYYLANGTVGAGRGDILPIDFDYSDVLQQASALEMIFAIWSNVLDLDDDGKPVNADYARTRAAQWIRQYCDRDYEVNPPFEEWETELPFDL
jgi:hypothetical protein